MDKENSMSFAELAYTFVNTPGIGGIVVVVVIGGAATTYFTLTRWILKGGEGQSERTRRRRRIK